MSLLSPAKVSSGVIWGAGPTFIFPSATNDALGQAKYQAGPAAVGLSFVGGLGGRDIAPEELFEIARVLRAARESGETPPPRLLSADELRETRKLQAIARVERHELGNRP